MTDQELKTRVPSREERAQPPGWPAKTTVVMLTLWGLLHSVGGIALMLTASGPEGLASLGSAVDVADLPATTNPVVAALVGFHGLNIAFAGLAVTALSLGWSWRSWPRGVPTSMLLAGAADVGLIVYLLGPGHMKIGDGIWGPLLLAIALLTGTLTRRASLRS